MNDKIENDGILHHLLAGYSTFLFNYPGTILLVTSIITTIIPAVVLLLNPLQINQNPETVSFSVIYTFNLFFSFIFFEKNFNFRFHSLISIRF